MDSLIERYVNDVVRRLPEKDRAEVSRELTANIQDMLPDDAGEMETRDVLNSMGPPAALAEKYRIKPRYLISPAVYDDYIRAVRRVVPLVGGILLVLGAVLGVVNTIEGAAFSEPGLVASVLSSAISMGISGAVQALLWVTVGFIIADRTGAKTAPDAGSWTVDDLPEATAYQKGRIPLSDSIVELVVTVVFTVIALLLCLGVFSIPFVILSGGTRVYHLFSEGFLAACVPAIAVGGLLAMAECGVKIACRRWTPPVCAVVIVSNLTSIGLMLYLFTRPQVFSPEFTAFIQSQEWAQLKIFSFMGNSFASGPLFIIGAIVVIASLAECAVALYRTVKARAA